MAGGLAKGEGPAGPRLNSTRAATPTTSSSKNITPIPIIPTARATIQITGEVDPFAAGAAETGSGLTGGAIGGEVSGGDTPPGLWTGALAGKFGDSIGVLDFRAGPKDMCRELGGGGVC